jgi:hypothetical protein
MKFHIPPPLLPVSNLDYQLSRKDLSEDAKIALLMAVRSTAAFSSLVLLCLSQFEISISFVFSKLLSLQIPVSWDPSSDDDMYDEGEKEEKEEEEDDDDDMDDEEEETKKVR